ncbi:MAG: amino acid adenylation domain-containing protein, partial [Dyella sp.]
MMSAQTLVKRMLDAGVILRVEDGRLKFESTRGALSAAQREELREHKDALIAYLSRLSETATMGEVPPLQRQEFERPECAASYAQTRLWLIDRLHGSAQYNMGGAFRIEGRLDEAALREALAAIVHRHAVLRTHLVERDGEVQQVVRAELDLPWQCVDLSTYAAEEQDALLAEALNRDVSDPFDLGHGPLLRLRLYRLAATRSILSFTMHHVVSDSWSLAVLTRELSALYSAFVRGERDPLPPLPVQYTDYTLWQRSWLQGEYLERQARYWETTLAGAPSLLELPTDRPRPSQQNHAGAIIEVKIERELTAALKHLSQAHGSTLFNTVLAAWAALLGRLSGQSEVVVGVPVANRSQPALEGLIGFFVNTLAVRLDVSPESTVTALLQHARQRMLEAQAHQDLPFELMVERIKPARSLSYSPVFQASLSWQNVEAVAPTLEDLQLQLMHGIGATAKFDVSLELGEADGCITGAFSYATALFDAATAQRHVLYFQRVLAAVAADPALQLGQIPLLDEAERRQVLEDWNATTAAYPLEQTVHGLVEAQVRRTPDAIALIAGEERVSYATLNAQANRLAHQLLALGVQPEERVALGVERSVALVVGLLAVWKAGAAYVPLDPGYPGARNRQILQEAAPRVLLLDAAGRAGLEPWPSGAAPCQVLDLDRFEGEAWPASDPSIAGRGGGQLAYVLFTSGSTGTPKGVMVEHGGLVNHGYWQVEQYGLGAQDVFLQRTSPAFDAAGWELWTPLSVGASLVLLPATAQHDAEAIMATVAAHEVSVLQLVPSLLAALPERLLAAHAGRLRYVFCGGEALSGELAARGARLAREGVINLYGPTEATIDASACRWEAAQHGEGGGVPIGRPIANTRLYILDAWGEPVPVGVRGEIHIGGAGVARGYLNQPALSAASFGPDRFHGGRMYRTGDMGRWRADGEVEYLGRNDGQVKVRGFRIEPGEIETQLLRQAGVREAAVVVREDRLVGYLVLAEEGVLATVRTQLAQHLPDYMVPAALVEVAALPRLPNGKLDRSGLPAPTAQAYAHAAYEAAQGDLERRLVQVWQGLLGLERVGRHDNFFELGGHSLLALRLLSRLREELEVELPLRELFAHPTVAGLAQAVRAAGGAV